MDHREADPWSEIALLLTVFFLGTNPVAVKYAVGEIPPLLFVALRFTLAGLLLLVLLRLLGSKAGLGRGDLLRVVGVGVVGVGVNNAAFTLGVSMTSASDTALIYAGVPVWGMILGFVLGMERPEPRGIVGVGLAFAGVGVIVSGGLGSGDASLQGDLLVVVATVCWGSYTVLSLPLLRRYAPLVVAAYTLLFGGLAVMPFGVLSLPDMDWSAVGSGVWGAMAYSTVFVAAFGFSSWQRSVFRLGANRVLVYQYMITLVGVSAAILLLGESFGVGKAVGGAMLLGGVYLARRR